jgi:phosphoenolpyruvate synthase/pyruvate phosphate dikinase
MASAAHSKGVCSEAYRHQLREAGLEEKIRSHSAYARAWTVTPRSSRPSSTSGTPAVKKMITQVISVCHAKKRKIGICGQAPSDYPDFAQFLVEQGIDSISINPDIVLKTTVAILEKERGLKR